MRGSKKRRLRISLTFFVWKIVVISTDFFEKEDTTWGIHHEDLGKFLNYYFETFGTIMVFCYQNCSYLLSEKNCRLVLKFEAEGRKFAKF